MIPPVSSVAHPLNSVAHPLNSVAHSTPWPTYGMADQGSRAGTWDPTGQLRR
jgi:hypothetical protein